MARREPLLRRIAREVMGDAGIRVWRRIEIIGDIAVIRVPFDTDPMDLKPLADAVLDRLPYVRSVWAGLPGVSGDYRLRRYVHLAGERRSETVYREHGFSFCIDILRVYVSPRLSYEHGRVAALAKPGETVVNMFAGAGFFSIIMAGKKEVVAHSIDINPYAYSCMVKSISMNKLRGRVYPYLGDAAEIVMRDLYGVADRVLMPLPELALEYLPAALTALRGPGYIHVYLHVEAARGEDPLGKATGILTGRLRELGARHRVLFTRKVRMVGPRRYQVVVDVYVEPP